MMPKPKEKGKNNHFINRNKSTAQFRSYHVFAFATSAKSFNATVVFLLIIMWRDSHKHPNTRAVVRTVTQYWCQIATRKWAKNALLLNLLWYFNGKGYVTGVHGSFTDIACSFGEYTDQTHCQCGVEPLCRMCPTSIPVQPAQEPAPSRIEIKQTIELCRWLHSGRIPFGSIDTQSRRRYIDPLVPRKAG